MRVKTFFPELRGCSYGSELARLSGLARRDEMLFLSHVNMESSISVQSKGFCRWKKIV